jgi:hypothetical protein
MNAAWLWLFSGERFGQGLVVPAVRLVPAWPFAGGTGNHDNVTSWWSGARRCDIVVVVPAGLGVTGGACVPGAAAEVLGRGPAGAVRTSPWPLT